MILAPSVLTKGGDYLVLYFSFVSMNFNFDFSGEELDMLLLLLSCFTLNGGKFISDRI